MTIVVAFVSPDAAVMASDTEGTEADDTRREIEKIWPCGSLLLGYTGSSVVRQPLQAAVAAAILGAEAHGALKRWDARAVICGACSPVLDSEYANHVPKMPPGVVPPALSGALLVAGRDDGGYWLLEVDARSGGSFYEERGFHAIGSGSVAAQVAQGLLAHYKPLGRSLAHLRLIAYRTVSTCIEVLGGSHGVGGSVRTWDAEGASAFAELNDRELARVANGVEQWTTIEAESLNRVVLDEPEPEGEKLPDALSDDVEATASAGTSEKKSTGT